MPRAVKSGLGGVDASRVTSPAAVVAPPGGVGVVRPHAGEQDRAESGLPVRTGLVVTGVALTASVLLTVVAPHLLSAQDAADTSLRRAVVLTLAFYVVGGGALAAFVLRRGVNLVWYRGSVVDALALGVPLGFAGGALGVAVNSLSAGHLQSDPGVTALVGGGGALRIALVLVTTAVLAPLVEETVFRGVCAGTLLAKGLAPAVWVSAVAFSLWHVNPVALRYYVVMGLVFAALWRTSGLVASMSAHAAFNGVLTLAAVAAVSAPYTTTTVGAVQVAVPGGWNASQVSAFDAGAVAFEGPSGEGLVVLRMPLGRGADLEQVRGLLEDAPTNGLQVDRTTLRTAQLPVGPALVADVDLVGQPGHVLVTVVGAEAYELVMVTGGSPAAERAWERLVRTLHLAPGAVR